MKEGRHGCLEKLSMTDVTEAVITKKVSLPPNTVLQHVLSNLVVGDQSSIAMFQNVDGWRDLAGVQTLAAFASAAQCLGFRISSCPLWTRHPDRRSLRRRLVFTVL